jgi:hypothetical protein
MKRLLLCTVVLPACALAAPLDMSVFQRYDSDRDGFVTMVEARGSVDLQGWYYDIDLDTDGRISDAEMQAFLAKPEGDILRDSAALDQHEQWRAAQRLEEAQREQAASPQPLPREQPAVPGQGKGEEL